MTGISIHGNIDSKFDIIGNTFNINNGNKNSNNIDSKDIILKNFETIKNKIKSLLSDIKNKNKDFIDKIKDVIDKINENNNIIKECCEIIDSTNFVKDIITRVLAKKTKVDYNYIKEKIENIKLYNGINIHVVNRQHVGQFAMIKNENKENIFMKDLFDDNYALGKFDEGKEDTIQIFGIDKYLQGIGNEIHKRFQDKYNKSEKYDDHDKNLLNNFLRPIYTIEAYKLLLETLEDFNTNYSLYEVQTEEHQPKSDRNNVIYSITLQRNPKSKKYQLDNKNLIVFGITEDSKIVLKTFYNKKSYIKYIDYNARVKIDNNKSKISNTSSHENKNEKKENNINTIDNNIQNNSNANLQNNNTQNNYNMNSINDNIQNTNSTNTTTNSINNIQNINNKYFTSDSKSDSESEDEGYSSKTKYRERSRDKSNEKYSKDNKMRNRYDRNENNRDNRQNRYNGSRNGYYKYDNRINKHNRDNIQNGYNSSRNRYYNKDNMRHNSYNKYNNRRK